MNKLYKKLKIDNDLDELVKLSVLMKNNFISVESIEKLKHKSYVINDFSQAIQTIDKMRNKLKYFYHKI